MKILLAIDGSEYSDAAVAKVAGMPWPDDSQVRVISAAEPPMMPGYDTWALPPDYFEELQNATRGRATTEVREAAETLREAFGDRVAVVSEVIDGYPKQIILDEAKDWGADLVVVGSHGYGGFARLFLGSVSNAVALHAPCSVMIVRGRGE